MNAGAKAFAVATSLISRSRSSLTSRSWSVRCARSTRPFAAGVLAQTMSMFKLLRARLNCVTPVPPCGSFRLLRKTPALSLYSATGLPCVSRYEHIAAK